MSASQWAKSTVTKGQATQHLQQLLMPELLCLVDV